MPNKETFTKIVDSTIRRVNSLYAKHIETTFAGTELLDEFNTWKWTRVLPDAISFRIWRFEDYEEDRSNHEANFFCSRSVCFFLQSKLEELSGEYDTDKCLETPTERYYVKGGSDEVMYVLNKITAEQIDALIERQTKEILRLYVEEYSA